MSEIDELKRYVSELEAMLGESLDMLEKALVAVQAGQAVALELVSKQNAGSRARLAAARSKRIEAWNLHRRALNAGMSESEARLEACKAGYTLQSLINHKVLTDPLGIEEMRKRMRSATQTPTDRDS